MGRVRLMPAQNSQDSIRKLLISVKVWYLQRERFAVQWTLPSPPPRPAWKLLRPLTTHSFLPVIHPPQPHSLAEVRIPRLHRGEWIHRGEWRH